MYEEYTFGDEEYTKYEPVNGFGIYIQAELDRMTREKVYDYLAMLTREAFIHFIGHDYKHHFQLGDALEGEERQRWFQNHGEERARYEMTYKPGSRAAVLVRRISKG